ncbi:hypothetical protein MHK_000640 [Candidatus Magnetomorum sp. HK-1]|nr:hypothetical protein MHK_000640 [Candidatus Magnetomorum sp. HK-1]
MKESDKMLYYQIAQVLEKEPAISILNVNSEQKFVKKRSKFDIRHKETIRLFLREYFELFFPELARTLQIQSTKTLLCNVLEKGLF